MRTRDHGSSSWSLLVIDSRNWRSYIQLEADSAGTKWRRVARNCHRFDARNGFKTRRETLVQGNLRHRIRILRLRQNQESGHEPFLLESHIGRVDVQKAANHYTGACKQDNREGRLSDDEQNG